MPGFEADSRFGHLFALGETGSGNDLSAMLRSASPEHRRQLLAKAIREQVAAVLGVGMDRISAEARLAELGLEPLMTFELAAALEAKIGARLPLAALQGSNSTVEELVRVLDRNFAVSEDAPSDRAATRRPALSAAEGTDYLRLRVLPAGAVVDPELRFEAAALTYVPDFSRGLRRAWKFGNPDGLWR